MSVVESVDPIEFTEAAAAKLKSLIEEEENERLMLRVYVTGLPVSCGFRSRL